MSFVEVWNEAYNIYTDFDRSEGGRFNDMMSFLRERVKAGDLSEADMHTMASDVMKCADI